MYRNVILSLFLLLCINCYSQTNYFQIHIGDTWIYRYDASTGAGSHGSGYDRYRITGTVTNNGKIYFIYSHERIITEQFGQLYQTESRVFSGNSGIRIDSITGSLYKNQICDSTESLIDSLNAKIGDSSISCNTCTHSSHCIDTSNMVFCNMNVQTKTFGNSRFECSSLQGYIKGKGLAYFNYHNPSTSSNIFLKGCVINGIVFCDTSFIVGVIPISSEVPNEFSLSQNYPNPFNPNSKIRFNIAKLSDVKLTVYDAMGNTVALLVDQQLKPGTYEADFDGSNLPSGVYFYKIITGDYSASKKMVLIK